MRNLHEYEEPIKIGGYSHHNNSDISKVVCSSDRYPSELYILGELPAVIAETRENITILGIKPCEHQFICFTKS